MRSQVQEFISDGCTGIPDLWIAECCIAHDYAYETGVDELTADLEFIQCVVEESQWLGPLAYVFGGVIFAGLVLFRPIYKRYKADKESGTIKEVDANKLNK